MIAELETKIKRYYEAKQFADNAKAQVDELGKELKELLDKEGVTKEQTSNGFEVSLIGKTTFKYDDEVAIKSYLRENSLNEYLVESIDSKRLNEKLKESTTLYEELTPYITKSTSLSLSVKESK